MALKLSAYYSERTVPGRTDPPRAPWWLENSRKSLL